MSTQQQTGDVRTELQHELSTLRRRSTTVAIARAISYIAYAWVVVSLIFLAFGFVLLLLGANPDAGFTQWVYRHVADTMEPFRGIFPQQTISDESTLDVSILFAMFVYSLIALGVRAVIDWLTYRRDELRHKMQRDEDLRRRVELEDQQRVQREQDLRRRAEYEEQQRQRRMTGDPGLPPPGPGRDRLR
jgi:uncharacterized protein YggT (Ycf19 family)